MGSDESKPQPKQAAPALPKDTTEAKVEQQIKLQKAAVGLDQNIENFRNKEAKYEAKIQVLKAKAKEHLDNGRQKQAKKLIQEATRLKKQLQSIEVRRKVIANKKDDLEIHQMNQETIDAMAEANKFTTEDLSDKLAEHVIAQKEAKMIQDQIEGQMKNMVEDEDADQAVEDMMKELQGEIIKDKKKKIEIKNPGVGVETNKKQVQKQKDDIEDMLANL